MNGSRVYAFVPAHHGPARTYHPRLLVLTIRQASSQHPSQVGHSHSILLSPPRGWVAPHRHRIGAPNGTFPSRRSIACRCPASGNQTNGRESGYGAGTPGTGDTSFRSPERLSSSGNRRDSLGAETVSPADLSDFWRQSRACPAGRGTTASTRRTRTAHHRLRILRSQRQRSYQLINHPGLHNGVPREWRLNRHPYLAASCGDHHRGNHSTAAFDGDFSLHNP